MFLLKKYCKKFLTSNVKIYYENNLHGSLKFAIRKLLTKNLCALLGKTQGLRGSQMGNGHLEDTKKHPNSPVKSYFVTLIINIPAMNDKGPVKNLKQVFTTIHKTTLNFSVCPYQFKHFSSFLTCISHVRGLEF